MFDTEHIRRAITMEATRTKKGHFVPQVHLRYFTSTPDETDQKHMRLWCFNKEQRKSNQARICEVAHQRDMYTYRRDGSDVVSFEGVFAQWETEYSQILRELHATPSLVVLLERKEQMAAFIALQYLRVALWQDVLRQYWGLLDLDDAPVTKEDTKIALMSLIQRNLDDLTAVFRRKNWILLHNDPDKTGKRFYTSDTPITLTNPGRGPRTPDLYVTSKGVEIHFPLSPRLTILMYNHDEYKRAQFEHEANPDDVDAINVQQVWWSQQFVFSEANDFALADRMVGERPELGNPRRRRISLRQQRA